MKNKTALKGGTYSIVLTTIVLAILVVVNIFAQALPSSVTQYDISSTKLYSITSNTKVVVNALEEDVTIYWVVQNGKEDDVIEKLLDKYDTLSDHIKIKKKNPDIYPTFTQKYTMYPPILKTRGIIHSSFKAAFACQLHDYVSNRREVILKIFNFLF